MTASFFRPWGWRFRPIPLPPIAPAPGSPVILAAVFRSISPSTWALRPRAADPSWGSLEDLPGSRRRPARLGRVRL
eukprot:5593895-Heterocapsa_arctica.AAC.1